MDEYAYRLLLEEGTADDIVAIGLEVDDATVFATLVERLAQSGVSPAKATPSQLASRGVADLARFEDPDGLAIELVYGPLRRVDVPFRSPRRISGFRADNLGLGHIVLSTSDIDRSVDFYTQVLGFKLSDFIHIGAIGMTLTFLHCNPRHHTLALAQLPAPKRLLHFMVETCELDDVMTTYYVAQDEGVPIARTLGRHTNDRMLSFYLNTPSGFEVEYGWGGRLIDDETWSVERHEAPSVWGHRPPAPTPTPTQPAES